MKKTGKLQWRKQLCGGMLALVMAFMLGMLADGFAIVSHAESQGRVTASSAKIRSEASTSSSSVGGAVRDELVSITGQVQGSDGYVWYEVLTGANIRGYIRSDLVELTDGSAPAATAVPETPAEVTEVNPVSATVTGGSSIRIRSNASTTSQILTTVSNGLALTVTGYANGTDGKVWYRVNFISNGSQVNGFIRSDFASLSGELTPVTENQPAEQPDTSPDPENTQEPEQTVEKKYDTILRDDGWWLYDTETANGWSIQEMFDGVENNKNLYLQSQKTVKSQKGVIIVLVILLVGAGAGVALLVFKIKDMSDSAYFNAVESETLRRRSAAASQGSGQRVMHTVGTEKQPARPAGAKPAGAAQGQRAAGVPQGQKPAGAAQGQKPAGTAQGQRAAGVPQGQKPVGAAQGQRPAGAAQGQKPAGAPQGQRPAGAAQGQRPAGAVQGQRAAAPQGGTVKPQPKSSQQTQGWQSKNFMADDEEEFDFEFLNVDGEDEEK